jgi:hypothetical protein
MYTYGESVKNALKMTEEWCNVFWKPWVKLDASEMATK